MTIAVRLHVAGQAHRLDGSCSRSNEHFGASRECRTSRDNIIDQRYGETSHRDARLHGESSSDVRLSLLSPQANLSLSPAGANECLLDLQRQHLSRVLSKQERLVETTLTKSSRVKWHRNERVNAVQLGDRACQKRTELRRSGPFSMVFELNDSTAQPAIEWSD